MHLMKFSAKNPRLHKVVKRFGYIFFRYIFIGQGGNEKAPQVFQHMLQLQQWGIFGYIATEIK